MSGERRPLDAELAVSGPRHLSWPQPLRRRATTVASGASPVAAVSGVYQATRALRLRGGISASAPARPAAPVQSDESERSRCRGRPR
jgi:hypothetical protein